MLWGWVGCLFWCLAIEHLLAVLVALLVLCFARSLGLGAARQGQAFVASPYILRVLPSHSFSFLSSPSLLQPTKARLPQHKMKLPEPMRAKGE